MKSLSRVVTAALVCASFFPLVRALGEGDAQSPVEVRIFFTADSQGLDAIRAKVKEAGARFPLKVSEFDFTDVTVFRTLRRLESEYAAARFGDVEVFVGKRYLVGSAETVRYLNDVLAGKEVLGVASAQAVSGEVRAPGAPQPHSSQPGSAAPGAPPSTPGAPGSSSASPYTPSPGGAPVSAPGAQPVPSVPPGVTVAGSTHYRGAAVAGFGEDASVYASYVRPYLAIWVVAGGLLGGLATAWALSRRTKV